MKSVLITGVSRGIGLGIAKEFIQNDYFVFGTSRSKFDLSKALESNNCKHLIVDVNDRDSIASLMKDIPGENNTLDCLVNNAGIFPKIKQLHKIDEEEWNEVLDVNLTGQFRFTKEAIPHLQKTSGCIINISSDAGLKAYQGFNADAYSASKAALIVLTKCWALEYAKDKIRVNCICPGVVDTDMTKPFLKNQKDIDFMNNEHPLGRIGQPEEIGKAVLYFTSDDASWVTGAVLTVDGGESIK